MHLAVKSSESVNSSRVVRQLLVAGVNPEIRNKQGLRPIEMIETIGIIDLQDELRHLLVIYFINVIINFNREARVSCRV
jgi:hypothetical protein